MRAFALVALLLLPAALPAATYHLEADGSGDFPMIAAALAVATAGDVVELGCGTYYEHDLQVSTGVTLCSEGGVASCATIDAQQQGRVLEGRPAALSGLTIRNGRIETPYAHFGAGAYLGAAVDIHNCNFVDNSIGGVHQTEAVGAGLYQYSGHAELSACRFTGNIGGYASAAYFDKTAHLAACRFEGNDLRVGGDHPAAGSLLVDCEFLACDVSLAEPLMQVFGSVFVDAELWVGGENLREVELRRCTFVDTKVSWLQFVSLDVHWCLFDGGEIIGLLGFPAIVTGLSYNDFHETQLDTAIAMYLGENCNFAADPLFCDAPGGDYRLHADSPCAPAGNGCGTLIGALPVGCDATALESRSWGSIKALY